MSLFNNLSVLESAGLIQVAKVEPDLEYLFRHSMVQDAAYASILESDRKSLHLAVGDAIEQLYPDRKRELSAILGYHFKEAGQDERALYYFIIAGDEALAVYANQEAEIQYRRALELKCCSGPEIAWLYSGLAEALYRQSRFDESLDAFKSGIDIYKSIGDNDGIARLYARVARVQWFAGNRPEGLQTCLEGLELLKDAPDGQEKATLIHETARAYYFNGNSDLALPLCRQALALAEKYNAVSLQADALATLGILAGITPEESLEALRKAVELAEANGFLQVAIRAHINLGTMTRTWLADNETALKHFHRAAELGKLRGVASEEVLGLSSYISCLFAPGRLEEIDAELPHLEELAGQISSPAQILCSIKFIKAVLISYRGDWDEAISIFWQCLQECREQRNQESVVNMLDELAWAILEKNRWGEPADLDVVEKLLLEAVQMVEQDESNERIWVYPRMAILRSRQGRLDEAHEWIEKTRQRMSTSPSVWDESFLVEGEAEIATTMHDWGKAIDKLEKLSVLEQQLGFKVSSVRSLLCLADLHLKRGNSEDLENAQAILRKTIDEFHKLGIGHYPQIAQDMLKLIQATQHAQTLDHAQLTKELRKARRVQESLLPENPPDIPGWDVAAVLEPAHETSGDFYDYLTLPDGSLGLVIADVTDKGTGAALFMALSRSLWRTFATDYPANPERTLAETNRRIMEDTHGGLYITLLYGVLNPQNGDFTYCSAGHHPALLLRAKNGALEQLESTGMPLGVLEETSWNRMKVNIKKGDALVLYTDGITDAQNMAEEFFSLERLQRALKRQVGKNAIELRNALLGEVHSWVGNAPQFDDITLMVVVREK
jgi:serine phosphatase RsbU (regulator of sigma subunit)